MVDLKTIEALAERISALLPGDARILHDEFKANVRVLLETVLARMELVTREEFEVQAQMLARTREKLAQLERDIAALESRTQPR